MIHHIHIILKYLDMIVQTCTRCRSWTCFIQPCTINPTFGHDLSKLGSKIQTWIKSIRKIGKYSNQKNHVYAQDSVQNRFEMIQIDTK